MKSLLTVVAVLSVSAAVVQDDAPPMPVKSQLLTADLMSDAALDWLKSLDADLRGRASMPFESDARTEWGYVEPPPQNRGVALGELSGEQRLFLDKLLRTGLSREGYMTAHGIILLEEQLDRDPTAYRAMIFGDPGGTDPWSWKFEGHHLSLNFTVQEGRFVTSTPLFFGADPAVVSDGVHAGLELFQAEEAAVFDYISGWGEGLRKAIQSKTGNAGQDTPEGFPDDIVLRPGGPDFFETADGVSIGAVNKPTGWAGMMMLAEFTGLLTDKLGLPLLNRYRGKNQVDVGFFWQGGFEPGEPFYFRLTSTKKGFALEYLNRGNHVHCVLRDVEDDFGLKKIDAWKAFDEQR